MMRQVCRLLGVGCAVLGLSLPAWAGVGSDGAETEAQGTSSLSASAESIRNFHPVAKGIFRSAHLETGDFALLPSLGVTHVLSLEDYLGDQSAAAAETQLSAAAGLAMTWQPLDPLAKPTIEQVNQALAFIVDPAHQPVLVHCLQGADRTGIVIAAYRIKYEHWSVQQAQEEMYTYGHSIFLSWWDDVLNEVK